MSKGFLTDEEREERCSAYHHGFDFVYNRDLSGKTVVRSGSQFNEAMLAKAVACFIGNWMNFTLPRLNGFRGLDTIDWDIQTGRKP